MSEWRTMIIEDDPHVAHVHRVLIERTPGFTVVGAAESGEEALRLVPSLQPQLLLLDLTLPGIDGVTFLRRLRSSGRAMEAIAVTASRQAEVVRAMAHLGVVDYLVKPFSPERLRQGLMFFLHRMAALDHADLVQTDVDALCASGRRPGRWLPKGLVPDKLDEIRGHLARALIPLAADEVGAAMGMARVTARRYLEYLLTTGQASVEQRAEGPGRPRRLYRSTAGTAQDASAEHG